MGSGIFGFGGSDSTATDQRQTAGDAGINARAQGSVLAAQPGSTLIDLASARLTTAPTVTGNKAPVSISYGDPAATQQLAQTFSNTIRDLGAQSSGTIASALQQGSDTLAGTLQSLSGLAESKQTQGQSVRDKTIAWLLLGLGGLVSVVLIFKFFRR